MNLNRRSFIKAIGLTTLSLMLTGCANKEERKTLSYRQILDYEIVTYETVRGNVALYTIYGGVGEYYALDISANDIDEYLIYDLDYDKEASKDLPAHENFIKSLNITHTENAILSLEENIGVKEEYTAKELQENLDIITTELNNEKAKILIK